jgi:hypothetical protein
LLGRTAARIEEIKPNRAQRNDQQLEANKSKRNVEGKGWVVWGAVEDMKCSEATSCKEAPNKAQRK